MAAGKWRVYGKAVINSYNGELNKNATTNWKLALFLSTSNAESLSTIEKYGDLTNEHANANGYTTGGVALSGVTLSRIAAQTISTLTRSGTTATCTTGSSHGLSSGMSVMLAGQNDALYSGTFVITVTGATTFTYTMTGTPSANASTVGAYSDVIVFTCTSPVFTASGGSIVARFGVIYRNNTDSTIVKPTYAVCLMDTTPADVTTTTGNTLTFTISAAGITNDIGNIAN